MKGITAVALLVLSVNTAQAQTPDPMHRMEFAAGGLLTGQTRFGSATATLFRPDGTPFDLFRTDSSLRPGFGIEAHLGVALSRAFAVEGTGSWLRTNFRTVIVDDAEDAVTDALTERLSRFTIEASALWSFWRGTKAAWFVRGGAGWMRELAGDSALLEDGLIGNVGVGMKFWWSRRDRGGLKRTGLRVEGRANLHSTGIVLGEEKLRITPVAAAHLIFGF